jgi:monovalent cation/hydrogen antiporter
MPEDDAMSACEHLQDLTTEDFPAPKTPDACEDCLAEGTGWLQLRECRTCGHVGCCDSSPRKHATAHFQKTQHPVMRSIMPGDTWTWCYVHEAQGTLSGAGDRAVPAGTRS